MKALEGLWEGMRLDIRRVGTWELGIGSRELGTAAVAIPAAEARATPAEAEVAASVCPTGKNFFETKEKIL